MSKIGINTISKITEGTVEIIKAYLGSNIVYQKDEPSGGTLSIAGPFTLIGESATYTPVYNNNYVSGGTWSIVSGSTYALISSTGELALTSSADESEITIQCVYNGVTAQKTIIGTYESGTISETTTETATDPITGQVVETITTTVTDGDGNISTSVTEITQNQDGSYSTTVSESVENIDGSGTYQSNTTNYDDEGNVTGTSESTQTTNTDGSYTGTTTNYDENGDPIDGTNVEGDTSGNVNTQEVEYDENGNEVVVGYNIDTSGNPEGSKNYNNDGVNTEYYALDATQGFIMTIHFTIDFTQQPPNQNDNHHNIVNSKRATPEPWYGFQIRQSSTNKYIQLGTQFATGSNLNQTVTTTNANKLSTNVYEYNIRIVYDPLAASNNFVFDELIGGFNYTVSNTFPDIEDLKYIKTTVGCALDANGDPFRFSNINVKSFSLEKLPRVAAPAISCDGQAVTMTCDTTGATIYYRRNQSGSYTQYTTPVSISADTVFEAYAELNGDRSKTTT